MAKKKYSIDEILYYLNGCLICRYVGSTVGSTKNISENRSLKWAIKDIEDPEDGIDAVLKRKKEYEAQGSKKASSRSH